MISANGIMAEKITNHGKFYVFAPIYFYSWGLQNGEYEKDERKKDKNRPSVKVQPQEGVVYHGYVEKRKGYNGRNIFYCIPNAEENLSINGFRLKDRVSNITNGDAVDFTVVSEPNLSGEGLFWIVSTINRKN